MSSSSELVNQTTATVIGAIVGAGVGGLTAFFMAEFYPRWQRQSIARDVSLRFSNVENAKGLKRIQCRAVNDSVWNIDDAILYVTIHNNADDIASEPGMAFIDTHTAKPVDDDRICWSLVERDRNPYKLTICAGESQAFTPFEVIGEKIRVPSEDGWSGTLRTELRKKRYSGELKLVSKSAPPIHYRFDLTPDSEDDPLNLHRLR